MAHIRVDQPFRKPDVDSRGVYVWYGPGGEEGDNATETTKVFRGWTVSEYQYVEGQIEDVDPDAPFLKTSTVVERKELFEALAVAHVFVTEDQQDDPSDAEEAMFARWATAYGVEKLAYWGGDKEEFVESLP